MIFKQLKTSDTIVTKNKCCVLSPKRSHHEGRTFIAQEETKSIGWRGGLIFVLNPCVIKACAKSLQVLDTTNKMELIPNLT